MVLRDIQRILDFLDTQPNVTSTVDIIGYCMSGQWFFSAAGTFPDRTKATAALHGTRRVTELADSPHRLIEQIQGELYLGFAAHDPSVEDFVKPKLTTAMDQHQVRYALEVRPGTEHGFCFPEQSASLKSISPSARSAAGKCGS